MTMSDRIAVFSHGELQQVGEPLEIYRAPANKFVAAFVGSPPMTFLEATMTDDGHLAAAKLRLAAPAGLAGLRPGDAVTVGVRPEDVALGRGGFEALAEVVEHLGALQLVHLKIGERKLLAQTAQAAQIRRGDRLSASIDAGQLYLFDAQSGRSIYTPGLAAKSFKNAETVL
jgi:ABC-type sugar transport system ATPase subunit